MKSFKDFLGPEATKQQDAAEIREKSPHIIVGCSGRIYDMIVRYKK
jgi:superfamily II DNA/RNA helicase